MTFLYTVGYILVAVVIWVNLYKYVYRYHRRTFPELSWGRGERAFSVLWAAVVSALWGPFLPFVILVWFCVKGVALVEPLLKKLEN